MVNIALPTGRLGKTVYKAFAKAGYPCLEFEEGSRKLVLENIEKGFRFLLVKPADVAIYVEHGVADIGVVGKDVLLETNPDIYELLDLHLGICKVAVAAPKGYKEDMTRTLKVATKYVSIAKEYYAKQSREIEIIKLNGSIELAPLLGLSQVIVDIVETGATLRENNLEVVTDIIPISARLIANKASYKFKAGSLNEMIANLKEVTAND